MGRINYRKKNEDCRKQKEQRRWIGEKNIVQRNDKEWDGQQTRRKEIRTKGEEKKSKVWKESNKTKQRTGSITQRTNKMWQR